MSHFAEVKNGIVTQVIIAEQDFIDTLPNPNEWIQTSYNTRENVHYDQNGEPDGGVALRANYAGIDYIYDAQNDVFYAPKPMESWVLNTTKWKWLPPIPYPDDGKEYVWNESIISWELINAEL